MIGVNNSLLYSLEVLGLNLHGTELVSLSACDTGKGVVDYSEGVYGLTFGTLNPYPLPGQSQLLSQHDSAAVSA